MKTIYKPNIRGRVKFHYLKSGKIFEFDNSIQAAAQQIIASNLAGVPSAFIDLIKVYHGVTLLCSKPVTSTTLTDVNQVQYIAIFTNDDFSGLFDKVELWCSAIGAFAQLTGFSAQTKPNNEQLSITWLIKIL